MENVRNNNGVIDFSKFKSRQKPKKIGEISTRKPSAYWLLFNFQWPEGNLNKIPRTAKLDCIRGLWCKCAADLPRDKESWGRCKGLHRRSLTKDIGKYASKCAANGGVAQLGEHLPCKQGVMGSNPIISTRSAVPTANIGEVHWEQRHHTMGCFKGTERDWQKGERGNTEPLTTKAHSSGG